MPSINFTDEVTRVPAAWANEVDALVHDVFGAAVSVGAARTALGLGSLALQASTSVELTGGAIDGIPIGDTTPERGNFTTLNITDTVFADDSSVVNKAFVLDQIASQAGTYGNMALQNANAVILTGGTMNGVVIGGTTPAAATFTTVTLGGNPVSSGQAATKGYVDGLFSALPSYGTIATQNANAIDLTGGTLNGVSIGATSPSTAVFTQLSAPYLYGAANFGRVLVNDSLTGDLSGAGVVLQTTNVAHPHVAVALGHSTSYFGVYDAAGTRVLAMLGAGRLLMGNVVDNNTSSIQTSGTMAAVSYLISGAIDANNKATSKLYVDTLNSAMDGRVTALEGGLGGFGTMSTQDADAVAITGGGINGTVIGGVTPAAANFTNITVTSVADALGGAAIDLTPSAGYGVRISVSNIASDSILLSMPATGSIDLKAGSTTVMQLLGGNRILMGATDDTSNKLQVQGDIRLTGAIEFGGSAVTGAGTCAAPTNCPAVSPTQPNTWLPFRRGNDILFVAAYK